MLLTTTGFGQDIVNASVRALYDHAMEEQSADLYYQKLGLTEYFPDVPNETLQGVTGPGVPTLTIEGQTFGSNEKTREFSTTLTMRKYTSELSWTEEDVLWLQKANESSKRVIDFKSMPSAHVNALNLAVNRDVCKVFYLGFGTTFLSVGNSEALYASHTIRKGGATQKNTFPTSGGLVNGHAPLGSLALTTAVQIMNRFQAMNAVQLLRCKSLKLIVPVELEPTAHQLILSDYGPNNNSLGLQTASQSAFAKRGFSIEVVTAPDIPAAFSTYWFLVCEERAQRRAFLAWGWKPRMSDSTENRKGTFINDASVFFGPVVQGWQWTFASKGDSSAS